MKPPPEPDYMAQLIAQNQQMIDLLAAALAMIPDALETDGDVVLVPEMQQLADITEQIVDRGGDVDPRLLLKVGNAAYYGGDDVKARKFYASAAESAERTGDMEAAALAISNTSASFVRGEHVDSAAVYGERAVEAAQVTGDAAVQGEALANLSRVRVAQDDLGGSMELQRAAAETFGAAGDKAGQAAAMFRMSEITRLQGDDTAAARLSDSAAILVRGSQIELDPDRIRGNIRELHQTVRSP